MAKLVWNVYIENINKRQIEIYNIFEHAGFYKSLIEIVNNYTDKDDFIEQLKHILLYYYWSKCEWEIIISDWPPSDRFNDKKVDVYEQVSLNWDVFTEYVWNNKELVRG